MKNQLSRLALALAAATAASLALSAAPALAADKAIVCLDVNDIQNTEVKDANTIIYHMKNGGTWENTLAQRCPGLASGDKAYSQRVDNNTLCANSQMITVNQTGETCRLGEFHKLN